jgi:Ca2+-binding RTX toxin-like protein
MSNSNIEALYDFTLQQMAAESYFEGMSLSDTNSVRDALIRGTNRIGYPPGAGEGNTSLNQGYPGYTRMTESQADEFLGKYRIIHQWSDDPTPTGSRPAPEGIAGKPKLNTDVLANTGLSATLIQDKATGSFTLAIRSTEFRAWDKGGDGERDKTGADLTDVAFNGFALAQLDALEQYYQWLKDNAKLPIGAKLNVTGYSLGAHLATVFTEIHQDDINIQFGEAVTFNGAGRGTWNTNIGSEKDIIAYYHAVLNDPSLAPEAGGIPTQQRPAAIAKLGQPFDAKSLYADPRYVWAVMATKDRFGLSFQRLSDESRTGTLADGRITQVFGYETINNTNFTANSGIHAPTVRVGIESQPLLEGVAGGFFDTIGDFGSGHSISLIADSLALQRAMVQLDGSFSLDRFIPILSSATNKVPVNGSSANYETDALENILDGLRRSVLGPVIAATTFRDGASGFGDITKRTEYQNNLKSLTDSDAFKAIAGKVRVEASSKDLGAKARNDFSALASLITLSPVVLNATTTADQTVLDGALQTVWGSTYTDWQTDKSMSVAEREAGKETFTDKWIADRALMLQTVMQRNLTNSTGIVGDGTLQIDRVYDLRYVDPAGAQQSMTGWNPANNPVGTALSTRPHQLIAFGGDAADVIDGSSINKFGDRVYGGGGADTIDGKAGNDYLEGNIGDDTLNGGADEDTLLGGAGNDTLDGGSGDDACDTLMGGAGLDTYNFSGHWRFDTIIDSDGSGAIVVEGLGPLTGAGARKVEAETSVWQTADKQVNYTLVPIDAGRNDLYISFSDRTDVIRIQNWSPEANKKLGITLPDAVTPPTTTNTLVADFAKATSGSTYLTTAGGYVAGAAEPGAADIVLGGSASDSLAGLLGNDGLYGADGDDVLDGGDGSDLLLGGTGADTLLGGAAADIIFGSAVGGISTPTSVNFTSPGSSGEEVARGFSWVAYRGTSPRIQLDAQGRPIYTLRQMSVGGAIVSPGWVQGGQTMVETEGNVIDGGAGNDYIAAGTGADTVHGGLDDDDILGMDGADVLFGDAGADFIWGDGFQGSEASVFTPLERHGNDILVGGAGNDALVGQGGDDELYGGSEDDALWGDDPSLIDTPASAHGNDYLDGGDGADELTGGGKDDTLFGGAGNDKLWGDGGRAGEVPLDVQGQDYLDGEDGNDNMAGGGDDDVLIGGSGNDTMLGDDQQSNLAASAHGDDYMEGGDGADVMAGGGGDDEMYGGTGNDQLQGDDAGANLDIAAHGIDLLDGGAGNDTLIGGGKADNLFGGDGDDFIRGDDTIDNVAASAHGDDYLDGGAGNDTLLGDGGNDTLVGGKGTDYLDGGAGNDTYLFAAGDSPLNAAGAAEVISDSLGVNKVVIEGVAPWQPIVVTVDASQLVLDYGGGSKLVVLGGAYGNVASYELAGKRYTFSELIGRFSAAPVIATDPSGKPYAVGGNSADSLTIVTGFGVLSGGLGSDTLIGGGGNNTYLYGLGDGSDHISDSSAKADANGAPAPNKVVFGAGITTSDVRLLSVGSQLALQVGPDSSDSIVLDAFDASSASATTPIDSFVFDDGTVLSYAQLVARGFDGTVGNDSISATALDDRIAGLEGDDTLRGFGGSDTYAWGRGMGQDVLDDSDTSTVANDTLRATGLQTSEVILSQVGSDLLIRVRNASDQIVVSNHFAGNGTGIETLVFDDGTTWDRSAIAAHLTNELTESADNFSGTSNDDYIGGLGGNDTVHGMLGNDLVDGGAGNDQLFGDDGNDLLIGGAGIDSLTGGNGQDTLDGRGDAAADTLAGGAGADVYLFGRGSGADSINDQGTDAASIDVLRLDSGITPQDVKLTGTYPIKLSIVGTSDSITFGPDTGNSRIERIEFADGTVWNEQQWQQRALLDSATEGNDVLYAFSNADSTIVGLGGIDALTGYGGNDTLDGGAGNDHLIGNNGNDSLLGGAADDWLEGGQGNDLLDGGTGIDQLFGAEGDDTLLDGETMSGGTGNDTYVLSAWAAAKITESNDSPGNKDVLILPAALLPGNLEVGRSYSSSSQGLDDLNLLNKTPGTSGVVTLSGYFYAQNATDQVEEIHFSDGTVWNVADVFARDKNYQFTEQKDSITGYRGNDAIDAKGGDDVAAGYFGDDSVLGGSGNDTLYGDDNVTWIDARDGNDTLDGGSGRDLLYGGGGNDTYVFGRASGLDTITEVGGIDRVLLEAGVAAADVTLFKLGQSLVLVLDQSPDKQLVISGQFSGTAGQIERIDFADGSGWDAAAIQAHTTSGNANAMTGTAGNDTFNVDDVGDTITEAANQGTDTVNSWVGYQLGANIENLTLTGYLNIWGNGNSLNNAITGNLANNVLDGKGGADTLIGLAGDDTYYADAATVIVEAANEGTDTVITTGAYTLGANLENLTISSASHSIYPVTYTGNALNNIITGTTWVGNDTFDGGLGADTMISLSNGGTYYVDNAGDTVVSGGSYSANSNTVGFADTVISSIDWTLSSNLENLQLIGGATHGTGNALNNTLTGGAQPALLEGMAGNDTYYVDWAAGSHDTVVEQVNEGVDTVVISGIVRTYSSADFPSVENLSLTSSTGTSALIGDSNANRLIGNEYANLLSGGDGADALDDGSATVQSYLDNDTLLGGAGNDSLTSNYGSDRIDGGAGDDLINVAANSQSTIVFDRGAGSDTVYAAGSAAAGRRILLAAGITSSDVQISRNGADLLLALDTGVDVLTWKSFFVDSVSTQTTTTFGYVEFADGYTLDKAALTARVVSGGANTATSGNDVLFGTNAADTLAGLGGDDMLIGGGGIDVYQFNRGDGQDVVVETSLGADEIVLGYGIAVSDVAVQRSGSDLVVRMTGTSDQITVKNGFIGSLRFADGTAWDNATLLDQSRRVYGTNGNDVLVGTSSEDLVFGLDGNDQISAGSGDDRIDGGAGADTMTGGAGNDVYVVDDVGDSILESAAEGYDGVESSVSFVLSTDVDYMTLTGTGSIDATGNALNNQLTGNAGSNVLTGGAGSDVLNGGAGADSLVGGIGDDSYYVDNAADVIVENANEGNDWIASFMSWVLGANLESLALYGEGNIDATGNSANNSLYGNAGNNLLDGGGGVDTLSGSAGDDIYVIDSSTDSVVENSGEGQDTVRSSAGYTLANNVENLALIGSTAINGTGNTLDNVLTGNSAVNTLTGGAGNDTLDGGAGNDSLVGGTGNDVYVVDSASDSVTEAASAGTDLILSAVTWTLGSNVENLRLTGTSAINGTGNTLANVITGNGGTNTLSGGTGADTLIGGAGDDSYVVDNAGDVVTELAGEGVDGVSSTVTWTLGANVEKLTLSGTSSINGTGNALNNVLTGNSGNNTLTGGAGNDTIDGGTGSDTMLGGAGNDTFVVNVSTDVVTENAGEGIDLVQSAITWTLGSNLENLTLTGTSTINGTGNTLDNWLIGNSAKNSLSGGAGNDTLDGGAGIDTLIGGAGDDVYVVALSTDVVTENANEGTDVIQSAVTQTLGNNVENLTLTGSGAINATGNTLANTLRGNSGANVLTGAGGDDIYDGGAGNDTFIDSVTTSNDTYLWGIGGGLDTLTDAGGSLDHIDLYAGIAKSQLKFVKNANDLELSVLGQTDKLTIKNWYVGSANQIEEFRLNDGSKVLASQVNGLLSAMAAFVPMDSTTSVAKTKFIDMPISNPQMPQHAWM